MLFLYIYDLNFYMAHMHLENLMLIDIETVSQFPTYSHLPERWQQLWSDKIKYYIPEVPLINIPVHQIK